jgi:protein involved in polysaccharide export with SLBB domain
MIFTGQPAPAGQAPVTAAPVQYVPLATTPPAYTAGAATSAGYPAAAPGANPATQPALMLRPVPPAVPAAPPAAPVIASSWQPVQHLEPAAPGPEIGGGVPVGETTFRPASEAAPLRPVPVQNVVDLAPAAAIATNTAANSVNNLPPARRLVPTPLPSAGAVAGAPSSLPREFAKQALPPYVVEPPDVLRIEVSAALTDPLQPLTGMHLVRPDGTISLGTHGTVPVAGLTIEQVRDAIAATLLAGPLRASKPNCTREQVKTALNVDVAAYNSKFYYIVTDTGSGTRVYRFPVTGNETILDALTQIHNLPGVASNKKIWLARATPDDHQRPRVFPVDWYGLVKRGSAATNYQVYPGDRIYVESEPPIRFDGAMVKFLAPIRRSFSTSPTGTATVNGVKSDGSDSGANH